MFTDRRIIEAEKVLFRSLAHKIGKHPRFLGFDLGNELSVLHYCKNPFTVSQGDVWLHEIMEVCNEIALPALPNRQFHALAENQERARRENQDRRLKSVSSGYMFTLSGELWKYGTIEENLV